MTYLDATRIVRRKGESQNSYLTCLTDAEYMKNQDCPRCWFRDLACRRIARSLFSTELQAADKAQEKVQDTNTWNVNGQIVLLSEALNLDSKTLLDDVFRSEASVLTCQTYTQSDDSQYVTFSQKTLLYWYHSDAQLIDVMKKSSGQGRNIFEEFFNRDCDASFFDLECAVRGNDRSKNSICSKLTVIWIRTQMHFTLQWSSFKRFVQKSWWKTS